MSYKVMDPPLTGGPLAERIPSDLRNLVYLTEAVSRELGADLKVAMPELIVAASQLVAAWHTNKETSRRHYE